MKSWSADIENKIKELSEFLKPRGLELWPQYVYHVTDVRNAASILQRGCLFSRIEARKHDLMIVDNASPLVMDGTRMECMEFVRLYFRPRTPTQYHNEGIRPTNQRSLESHCPVPIFLCFDSRRLLAMNGTRFSNGNMGRYSAKHSDQREFYLDIPFEYVFHEGPFKEDQKDAIIFHRNAEVLVPNCLPIENTLKYIVCRSRAELQTVWTLLPSKVADKWQEKFRLDTKNRFFYREWTYVDLVLTTPSTIAFSFNPSTRTPGPFTAKVTYKEDGNKPRYWQDQIVTNRTLSLGIKNAKKGTMSLELDGDLAYKGRVIFKRTVV